MLPPEGGVSEERLCGDCNVCEGERKKGGVERNYYKGTMWIHKSI